MRVSRLALALLFLAPMVASAGGPRFVTGPPFFTGAQGVAIGWKQPTLLYFTDPGSLSASVNHQAADALVLAAASVWNVPVAGITVAQGGALAEDVSGLNVYLDTSGMVFPADVMSTNAAAIPVAVIYDSDGSVTDLLLGAGASLPSACRHNGVTETVDSFDPAGYILHAILVVNGRCTGAAPELQLELQYQLMRAFGRVLGLAWSQTNDNVFTGSPTPTYNQALNWPIMHPLDIICGLYAYQCLPNPFQLRADDVAGMVGIYPIAANAVPAAGKQVSLTDAQTATGHVYFPTGQGMAGVNVLVLREPTGGSLFDAWYETSAVSGALFQSAGTSAFVAADTSAFGSFGSTTLTQSGSFLMPYVPIEDGVQTQNIKLLTEPINPLYDGAYGIVPYVLGAVAPSGSAQVSQTQLSYGAGDQTYLDFTIADAAPACGNGQDGTPQAPMPIPATGWWTGLLCGYGHTSYVAASVTPGRTFTLEMTALDDQGIATLSKAMPVIGVFAPTDAPGDLPSVAVAPTAFQAVAVGTTTLSAATNQLTSLWFGVADERGDGRPDFAYQARMFYADDVVPAELPLAGGTIILNGLGFRPGNAVTINGVAASVLSWSANAIVVTAPSSAVAKAADGVAVDVEVRDLSSGATSTMSTALTYTSASRPNVLKLISAPAGTVYVGDVAAIPFTVQLVGADGVTPVAGSSIVFSVPVGSVGFSACPAASCTLVTDANGMASSSVTPTTAGAITLQAASGSLTQSASFTAEAQTGLIVIWYAPSGNQPVGIPQVLAVNDRIFYGGAGRAVTFTVPTGSATFSPCGLSVCTVVTDSGGDIALHVTPTAIGPITITATDGDLSSSISFTVVNNTDTMVIASVPAASVYVDNSSGAFGVTLYGPDGISLDFNETVTFTASAGVVLYPCSTNVCATSTGWSGTASVGLDGLQVGTYTVQAVYGALSESATFTVVANTEQIQIVSGPVGNVPVATTASTPFSAQVLYDGYLPVANVDVTLAGVQGQVALGACNNNPSCRFSTDANGIVSTSVTPLVAGVINLTAIFGSSTETTSFTAVGADAAMSIVVQPGPAGVLVGDYVNLAVQVIGPGGVTPVANDLVVYTVLSGAFSLFWGGPDALIGTDGNGVATELGMAGAPGPITIFASDGVLSQIITFVAYAKPGPGDNESLIALNPQTWISAGSTVPLTLNALVQTNDSAAAAQAVQWTAVAGFQSTTLTTVTDNSGASSTQAVLGPLQAGSTVSMTACAWTSVCAVFQGIGVALASQAVAVVSGGLQSVTGPGATAPVVVQVVDGAGDPVVAAQVSIYQTVRAFASCPVEGRCPAAPILATQATVVVSGLDGRVSVTPLGIPGTATQTDLAFSVGTSGFASTVVSNQP